MSEDCYWTDVMCQTHQRLIPDQKTSGISYTQITVEFSFNLL